ncbi:hypothetical protein K7X08_004007 [Anisodus acutangulus]|uniref:Non-haem dioxygenase N-terminal domain-containing protein n=1 Tax=Anisodus acutangulus TaxID=402998 RepID=A0A9Q1RJP9_9SOLA|nr:hypothetical protein K7X08_004007 [Anisodus acutangulus]
MISKEDQEYEMINKNKSLIFDGSLMKNESNIPSQFIWPDHEKPNCASATRELLQVPLIDLSGLLPNDPNVIKKATSLVNEACSKHGFFLVINHGVDTNLIKNAHVYMDKFFELSLCEKQKAQRKIGEHCGYASSFTGRFSSKLPWKETLSFQYSAEEGSSHIVEDYFQRTMGENFSHLGKVYQDYCHEHSFSTDHGTFGVEPWCYQEPLQRILPRK